MSPNTYYRRLATFSCQLTFMLTYVCVCKCVAYMIKSKTALELIVTKVGVTQERPNQFTNDVKGFSERNWNENSDNVRS